MKETEDQGSVAAWARRRFLRAQSWAALRPLALGLVVLVVLLFLGFGVERHLAALEAWVVSIGPWGMVAFVGLFVLGTSLLLPESLLGIAAGALFGLWWGTLVAVVGGFLAGAVQFGLAHWLLRARIERALAARPSFAAIARAVRQDEVRLQILLRLTPLNPAITSYLLGAAGVRFRGFLAACLALVPNLFVEVYLGYAGKHAVHLAGGHEGMASLHNLVFFGGLAVGIVVLALVSKAARQAVLRAVAETEAAGPESGTACPT